ncbi:hypothetical protein FHS95_001357 [Sphingomonas naasensis]|uniref:YfiR family protein n=1 Tax=Sphingomonas naasensis TaxID=1344951 RepID=A0A4V6RAW9_9SPHN|nr:YfiR family protein [Sphingomonas naasensis]NIJ19688.1 hypothetical protein [Sphingomonas naasensis]TGX37102.1 YfiR family protein [Sphingomonas naasensis]
MRRAALLLALGAIAAPLPAAAPARAQASEEAIKAAFLPKFVRYIALPTGSQPEAEQPYYLCVIGRDPFGATLDRAAASEAIDGHPVAVRRFANADAPAIAGCHVAFVAGANDQQTADTLAALRSQATLTITDSRWSKSRGMIHFTVAAGRVRFHIDDAAAAACGIAVSSRLLALAIDVKQRTP